jgi:TonB family protein
VPLDLAPEIAAKHRGESIGLSVTVGEDGVVKRATVISEVCPECDRAALEAVKKFRFKPARDAGGRPVEATIGIPIRL